MSAIVAAIEELAARDAELVVIALVVAWVGPPLLCAFVLGCIAGELLRERNDMRDAAATAAIDAPSLGVTRSRP